MGELYDLIMIRDSGLLFWATCIAEKVEGTTKKRSGTVCLYLAGAGLKSQCVPDCLYKNKRKTALPKICSTCSAKQNIYDIYHGLQVLLQRHKFHNPSPTHRNEVSNDTSLTDDGFIIIYTVSQNAALLYMQTKLLFCVS